MPPLNETASRKIKICYFCSLDTFDTGMPISTSKLIEHFAQHPDFQVSVILPGSGELYTRIRRMGIEPRIVSFKRLRSPRRLRAFSAFLFTYPLSSMRIALYLRKNKIDIVHFSDIIDVPFYPCALLGKAKTVAHLRHCIESRFARLVFSCMARVFADKVICISKAVQRFSGLLAPLAEVVLNPGPDPKLFDPKRKTGPVAGWPQDGTVVVSVGAFLRVKGHEHFVRMARAVEDQRPGLCRFVIVGSVVPGREAYYREVKTLIASLGLGGMVTILDPTPHEQVPRILARSAIFVHAPNWQEGLGGAVLEAMSMEVPVVAFNCGGVAECFTNELSGFLIAQGDVTAAVARIIELLDNTELRKKMGTQARQELLSKFSYQRHFPAVEAVYRTFFNTIRA